MEYAKKEIELLIYRDLATVSEILNSCNILNIIKKDELNPHRSKIEIPDNYIQLYYSLIRKLMDVPTIMFSWNLDTVHKYLYITSCDFCNFDRWYEYPQFNKNYKEIEKNE